jgi:hypothetical protein
MSILKTRVSSLLPQRGIFANDSFIIEDSAVDDCGGYGIGVAVGTKEERTISQPDRGRVLGVPRSVLGHAMNRQ